jgi:hypothetical protein
MLTRAFLRHVAALLWVFACASAFGQVAGAIRGSVFDPSGAVVAGAQMELVEAATNLTLHSATTASGDYFFANLNSGKYDVVAKAPGFRIENRSRVVVTVGQTVSLDLKLAIGGVDQGYTVTTDAPLLQVETSNIETNIPVSTVVAMPLNSRNFIQLSTLVPGVELPPGTVLPRINGGRPRTNEYLYDGISALQPEPGQVAFFPILDDIAEFTIEANDVPAEFGRFNGGVVNVATRAGSNTLHGSLYEFFRNEDLNARTYFAAAAPARKPEYRRNLYGATLGAPVLHDKLFFFGDFEDLELRLGVP